MFREGPCALVLPEAPRSWIARPCLLKDLHLLAVDPRSGAPTAARHHIIESHEAPVPGPPEAEADRAEWESLERQRGLLSSTPQEPYRSYSHSPLDVVLGDPVGIEDVEASPRSCILMIRSYTTLVGK